MKFKIILYSKALKQLEKLDKNTQKRIIEKIKEQKKEKEQREIKENERQEMEKEQINELAEQVYNALTEEMMEEYTEKSGYRKLPEKFRKNFNLKNMIINLQ